MVFFALQQSGKERFKPPPAPISSVLNYKLPADQIMVNGKPAAEAFSVPIPAELLKRPDDPRLDELVHVAAEEQVWWCALGCFSCVRLSVGGLWL